jgi:YHS domain-containing protein
MEALIYFIFWALVIFLMMRFGCGAHVMGHGHKSERSSDRTGSSQLRWIPPEQDRDPVCGTTVTTASAKPSIHDGTVYYFCSHECREQFEAAPHLYVGGAASRTDLDNELEQSDV